MWRLGVAQTRSGWRRLIAAGIAVAIGTAFLTALLIGGQVLRRAALDTLTTDIGAADLQVTTFGGPQTPSDADLLRAGAESWYRSDTAYGVVDAAVREFITFSTFAADPRLSTVSLTSGRMPTADDEITLSATQAVRLGVGVGNPVTVQVSSGIGQADALGDAAQYTLVGLTAPPPTFSLTSDMAYVTDATMATMLQAVPETALAPTTLFVITDDVPRTMAVLRSVDPTLTMTTRAALADQRLDTMLGGSATSALTVVLAFLLVAFVVAALVITNIFHVLLAQRSAAIGLLRAVGATRGQVRRGILTEGVLLGAVGGFAGVLLGHVIALLVVLVLGRLDLPLEMRPTLPLDPLAVLLPMIAAVALTLVAVWLPSRAAAATAPLAAIRTALTPRPPASKDSIRAGVVLIVTGTALVVLAFVTASNAVDGLGTNPGSVIAMGIAGGAITIIGLLMSARAIFPPLTRALGAAIERLTPRSRRATVRLTRAHLVRTAPRQTATSIAVLVGVTLVAMLTTGAVNARAGLESSLVGLMPTDIVVDNFSSDSSPFPGDLAQSIAEIDGVEAVAAGYSGFATVRTGGAGGYSQVGVSAFDPATLADVSYDDRLRETLADGTLVLDSQLGIPGGATVSLSIMSLQTMMTSTATVPTDDFSPVALTSQVLASIGMQGYMTLDDFAAVAPELVGAPTTLWVRVAPGTIEDVAQHIAQLVPNVDENGMPIAGVSTPGLDRNSLTANTNLLVSIAVALLSVSILIALIGVANALTLAVFERRREIAIMRSVGLTRRQLRASLALEGLVMTLAATLVGVVLGTVYGLVGARLMFPGGQAAPTIPLLALCAVVLISCCAGAAASAAPSRTAARLSPLAALTDM